MRTTLILLFTCVFCSMAEMSHTQNARVTINKRNVTLKEVLNEIESQTDYLFIYSNEVNTNENVSVKSKEQAVANVLNKLLKDKNVDYSMEGNHIILTVKENEVNEETASAELRQQQKKEITGRVVDAAGIPVIGANIIEVGTTNGTVTDVDGNFTLSVEEDATIRISYIGYLDQTLATAGQSAFNITLLEDTQALEEVVVVGYGTMKKVNLTGAVASVSGEALENKPATNIGQALEGVIPNLNVSATNAQPNAVPSFNVRGGTSMTYNPSSKTWVVTNGSPLILVDGVQMDDTYLSMLNPNDIESISLLKDAASAAIYGARAAYGVLLVTTKSGKKDQKPIVTYKFNMQGNTPSHRPDIMDAYTIQLAVNQLTQLTGGTVSTWDETLLAAKKAWRDDPLNAPEWIYKEGSTTSFAWVRSMNPFDEAVRDWTPTQKHTVSITGGTNKAKYYISLGYQRQDGMYKINTDVQNRYNGIMSIENEINDWFKVATKISYNTSSYDEPYLNPQKGNLWSAMMTQTSRNICMPIKTSATDPQPDTWTDNILGWIAYGATRETKRANAIFNVNPTITLMPGWTLKGEFSYRPTEYYQKTVIPTREYVVDDWTSIIKTHTDPSSVSEITTHSDYYTINAYTNFDKTFGKHNFGAVLGFNQEWQVYRATSATAEGILNASLPVINTATGNQYAGDNAEHWAIRGAFGRLNYIINDRYLFEFNGRYDGTSRFPKNNRFKFFPSFSAGWRISEESFMEVSRRWLDNLKIRGSWGSLGNQNVDNYAYIASYGSVDYVSYNMGGTRPFGISPSGLVSPSLTWETATTIDLGLDATFLNNRFDFTFDWYSRRTNDILMAGDKFPAVLGTSAPNKNSGVLRTNGWELSLGWKDKLDNGLRYDLAIVLSDYMSKVVKFNGNPTKSLSTLYDGKKAGEIWGYTCLGILQEDDFEIDENGKYQLKGPKQTDIASTWYPGDLRFADIGGTKGNDENNSDAGPDGKVSNGENTVYNPGDLRVIGNSIPRYRFGINSNFYWKKFSLNVFFQGVAKRDVFISDNMLFGGSDSGGNYDTFKNSWTPENPTSKYHMYGRGQNLITNTKYLYNGAFIRLKTLSLGYTLPQSLTEKISLHSLRFNLSGYNLFEISEIPGVFDPESIQSDYPMMRSIALGVQVNF